MQLHTLLSSNHIESLLAPYWTFGQCMLLRFFSCPQLWHSAAPFRQPCTDTFRSHHTLSEPAQAKKNSCYWSTNYCSKGRTASTILCPALGSANRFSPLWIRDSRVTSISYSSGIFPPKHIPPRKKWQTLRNKILFWAVKESNHKEAA